MNNATQMTTPIAWAELQTKPMQVYLYIVKMYVNLF